MRRKTYQIIWSPIAELTYLETISFILEKWTVKEATAFEEKVESLLDLLKNQKKSLPTFKK